MLDIDMPRLDGFGVAKALQQARLSVEVVFLTLHSEEDLFHAAMELSVKGYILKESAVNEIVQGIKAVADGQHFVTPSLTGYLLNRRQRAQQLTEEIPGLASRGCQKVCGNGQSQLSLSKQKGSTTYVH